jgi:phosphoglycolate phosphatase
MAPTLVLDLDGTLVDSVPDIRAALNRVMDARGLPPFEAPAVAAMVGDGVRVLVERAFAARNLPAPEADIAAFTADYSANATVESRLFPGVPETLEALRGAGWKLAVCTNKPAGATRALLETFGIAPLFDAVGAGDSFPTRKPDPAHLRATLAAAGGDPARAVMAGDHHNDVAAATGAGVPCIFAAWGYGQKGMEAGAAAIAATFSDLPAIATRLLPAG